MSTKSQRTCHVLHFCCFKQWKNELLWTIRLYEIIECIFLFKRKSNNRFIRTAEKKRQNRTQIVGYSRRIVRNEDDSANELKQIRDLRSTFLEDTEEEDYTSDETMCSTCVRHCRTARQHGGSTSVKCRTGGQIVMMRSDLLTLLSDGIRIRALRSERKEEKLLFAKFILICNNLTE